MKRTAVVGKECVACGRCIKECPFGAISVHKGVTAVIADDKCIGCGKCVKACPADVIFISPEDEKPVLKTDRWYDYLWILLLLYLALGFFNILFAWLGLIFMMVPLIISIFFGSKAYCNKYCGRAQLYELIGGDLGLSRKKSTPKFIRSNWFRYGFLTFFMATFLVTIYSTYLVFAGATLNETVTLLWTFDLPWNWTNTSIAAPWVAQFAFGFYGAMLTTTILGVAMMVFFKPRSWCVYCPMGTMTQGICKIRNRKAP